LAVTEGLLPKPVNHSVYSCATEVVCRLIW
jgi:hypothetical protein